MIHREELLEDWRLCRENAPAGEDRAVAVSGEVSMYWDVVEVKPEPDYGLFVRFKDGLAGRVQLRREELTGALAPLLKCSSSNRSSLITARSPGLARSIWRRMRCMLRSPARARATWRVGARVDFDPLPAAGPA